MLIFHEIANFERYKAIIFIEPNDFILQEKYSQRRNAKKWRKTNSFKIAS